MTTPPLHQRSSVLGVITHYRCESWLAQAIESLLSQTHPLDGIVVIDDASPEPPVKIVRQFPQVTLLAAARNVGPYCLIQAVIDRTRYDAYLQQDADDWSGTDRLEVLLGEAEVSGAELLGTASVNLASVGDVVSEEPRVHPFDVNAAFQHHPEGWHLSWGTSIVARALVMRLGGLATGLRFAGDVEFTARAHHVSKVVNVPQCCYYRRRRPDALTSDPATGKGSPQRTLIRSRIRERAAENAAAVASGLPPNLAPLAVAAPLSVEHLAGPALYELSNP